MRVALPIFALFARVLKRASARDKQIKNDKNFIAHAKQMN